MRTIRKGLRIAIIIVSSIIAALLLTLLIIFLINNPNKDTDDPKSEKDINTVVIDGKKYLPKEGVLNFLIFGIDEEVFDPPEEGKTIRNSAVADFIAIVTVDTAKSSYSITMVNRDTVTLVNELASGGEIYDTRNMQIGFAHTYGAGSTDSVSNLERAIKNLLYIKPDYYVRLTMGAVPTLVDDIGGVDVTIEGDLSSLDASWTNGATVHLDGDNAIKYVRARQSVTDGTNLMRMERQKTFIESFVKKLSSKTDLEITDLLRLVSRIPDNCYLSDADIYKLRDLYGFFNDYTFTGFNEITGYTVYNTYAFFYPNYDSIKKIAREKFLDERTD